MLGYRPIVTVSLTVIGRASFTLVVWRTSAIRSLEDAWLTWIDPEVGSIRPAMPARIVDLPDPFGPIKAVTAPTGTVKEEAATAMCAPYRYSTSVASIATMM